MVIASLMILNIKNLLDNDRCYEAVRQKRWPNGIRCPHCDGTQITKQGRDSTQPARQKYRCNSCLRYFDDLTGTVFAGHHQQLKTWILCIYFMGLNLSNQQIAKELELNKDDAQRMTQQLREGIVTRQVEPVLTETVECDEVYVVAGHKGNPDAVAKKNAKDVADA